MSTKLQGALRIGAGAGLSAGLYMLLAVYWPLGPVASLSAPLPLAATSLRVRTRTAVAAMIIAALIVTWIFGAPQALQYIGTYGIGGVLLGTGIRHRWPPQRILGGFALAGLATLAALLMQVSVEMNVGPAKAMEEITTAWVAPMQDQLQSAPDGLDGEMLRDSQEVVASFAALVSRIPVGIIAGMGLFIGWLNALTFRRSLAVKGFRLQPWSWWKAPEQWIWGLILAGALTVSGQEVLVTIGLNLLIPMVMIYFFQGMAIIQSIFEQHAAPRFMRVVFYALIILQIQTMSIFVAMAGAFDQWLDLRKRLAPPPADSTG